MKVQRFCMIFFVLLQIIFCSGCETLYVGKGVAVHDDQEAMNFAWLWFNEGNYDQARQMVNTALNINPENADAYNVLGLIELRNNSTEKAVEYLEKANSFGNSKDTPIFHNLGFAYFKNGEYEKSLEVFNSSLRQKQTCLAKLGVAMSSYKLGDRSKGGKWIDGCSDRADFAKDTKRIFNYFSIDDADLKGFYSKQKEMPK